MRIFEVNRPHPQLHYGASSAFHRILVNTPTPQRVKAGGKPLYKLGTLPLLCRFSTSKTFTVGKQTFFMLKHFHFHVFPFCPCSFRYIIKMRYKILQCIQDGEGFTLEELEWGKRNQNFQMQLPANVLDSDSQHACDLEQRIQERLYVQTEID